jgi:uncharacterized repeat protein (TIGR01451 family)
VLQYNRAFLLLCLLGALASPACFTSGGGMMMPPPLMVTNTAPPAALAGQAFSFSIQVTGGTDPYTLAESTMLFPGGMGANGTPCQGLMINFATGAVTGTPVNSGTCGPVSFTVTDSSTPALTFQFSLSFRVAGVLSITTATLPNGTEGAAYNQTVATSGGATPLVFSISAGALPAGLMLNATTGAITGMPTMGGTFNFTVRAADSLTPAQAVTQAYTILVLQITTSALPGGTVNAPYNQQLAITGEVAPVMWALAPGSGPLPPPLMLDPNTGIISGTPTQAGTFNFTAQATDSGNPARTHTRALSITIAAAPMPLSITTTTIANGVFNVAYNQTIMTAGGVGPLTFAIILGSLPAGMNLDPNTGIISGMPTAGGMFPITVEVTDSSIPAQTASQAYTLLILQITTQVLPSGLEDQPYSQNLNVTGEILPVAWVLASAPATLPPGLMLSAGGTISGIPQQPGTFNFMVQVTDSDTPPRSDVQSLTITIAPSADLVVTKTDTPDPIDLGTGNVTYTITVSNNSTSAATNVVLTDTLPASFTFVSVNPAGTCMVNGQVITCNIGVVTNATSAVFTIVATPTAAGTFTNTAIVTSAEFDPDLANNTVTENTIVTSPPTAITDIHITRTAGAFPFGPISTFRHDAVANTLVLRQLPPPATFPIPYTGTQPGPIVGDNSLIAIGEFDNFDLDFTDGFVTFFAGDGAGNFAQSGAPVVLGSAIRALAFDPTKTVLFVSYTKPAMFGGFEEHLAIINVSTRAVLTDVLITGTIISRLLPNPDPNHFFLYTLGPNGIDTNPLNANGLDDLNSWTYSTLGVLTPHSAVNLPFPNDFAIRAVACVPPDTCQLLAISDNLGFQRVRFILNGLFGSSGAVGPIGGGGLFSEALLTDPATDDLCKYTVDGGGNLRIFRVEDLSLAITQSVNSPFPPLPGGFFFTVDAHPTAPIIYVYGVDLIDPDGPGPIPGIPAATINIFNVDVATCDLSSPVPNGLFQIIPGPPGPNIGTLVVPH